MGKTLFKVRAFWLNQQSAWGLVCLLNVFWIIVRIIDAYEAKDRIPFEPLFLQSWGVLLLLWGMMGIYSLVVGIFGKRLCERGILSNTGRGWEWDQIKNYRIEKDEWSNFDLLIFEIQGKKRQTQEKWRIEPNQKERITKILCSTLWVVN